MTVNNNVPPTAFENKFCALNLGHYTVGGGGVLICVSLSHDCKLICERQIYIYFLSLCVTEGTEQRGLTPLGLKELFLMCLISS